uniref:Uncharacterized protein n=1 Tax=Chaetoceros debilis TaxID=122233 RepID=A0A6S8XKN6_9STRA
MDSKPPSSSGSSFPQQPLVAGSSEATQKLVITQALKPSPQEPNNEINNDIGNGRDDFQQISSPLTSASRKRSLDNNLEDIMMEKGTMDKKLERIRNDIRACNKLKLKLYMEAMRVHKGNGEDRKYADYWHAISRYLSTTGMIRSCSDMDINGIEEIFESFLKTKKMKKLHNAFVKSIMKQILETDASRLQIGEHVPIKWRKRLRYPEVPTSTKGINSQPTDLEGIESVKEVFISDTMGSGKTGRNVFWGSLVSKIPNVNIDASDAILQDDFGVSSSRLPGIMEIDHISRYAAETEGYCLSQSAQWITSIAVKDYISNILRDTITHIDDEDRKGDRKRKRKRMTNYDIARTMESSVSQPSAEKGKHASLPASRIAWERIVGNSCLTFANGVTPELEKFQTKMNTLVDNEIDRRSHSIMNKSNFRESRFGSKNLSSMSTRQSASGSTSEFASVPSSREMLGVQMALNPNQPAVWTAPTPSHPSSSAPSQNTNVLATNGQNIDAEALYSAMRQRGSFLSESIGADVSRISTPQQSSIEGAQGAQEGPNPSLAFGGNNLAGTPFATAQPMLPQNNQFGALALPENGETIPFQQLNDIMGSQRPNSESANRRPSSNSAIRNMGGGRGKGSKDLSAMLARNMARD